MLPGQKLLVSIVYNRDERRLEIRNKQGKGMGIEELKKFFSWGLSNKVNRIGRYGQGGKAALGYLGKGFKIKSHPLGSQDGYYIKVEDWTDRTNGFKEFAIEPYKALEDMGFVSIQIDNLTTYFDTELIKQHIKEIYRPLIIDHKVSFFVDSDEVKCPLARYDDGTNEVFERKFNFDGNSYTLFGEYGIVSDKTALRGGFNVYQFDRRIVKKEYFGLTDPSKRWNTERLYGELYINFEIPLLMNKTDFQRSSPLWSKIQEMMQIEIRKKLQQAIDYRAPVKSEVNITKKMTKKIESDELNTVELALINYGPNLLFKAVEEKNGKTKLQINREHVAYKKWGKKEFGIFLYEVMIYSLYEASMDLSKKEASKLINTFTAALRKYSEKFL